MAGKKMGFPYPVRTIILLDLDVLLKVAKEYAPLGDSHRNRGQAPPPKGPAPISVAVPISVPGNRRIPALAEMTALVGRGTPL